MAIFIPNIKIETVNKCKDLKITDNSVFTEETPKSIYDTRRVVITKPDGTVDEYNFPIGDNDSDILLIENYQKDNDYYINIKIYYEGEVDPQYLVIADINHISTCNALVGRSKLMNTCDCGCDDKCIISKLTKLDTSIENSIYAASFKLGVISQEFLNQSLTLVKALESDCNCK